LILRWLESALKSRFEQLDYIAQENPTAAARLDERVEFDTSRLLKYSRLGRKGRVAGTRELLISQSPFIVVYRIKKNRIEILRMLHGAQQYPGKRNYS
jgi:toxin ParE1/3/4